MLVICSWNRIMLLRNRTYIQYMTYFTQDSPFPYDGFLGKINKE